MVSKSEEEGEVSVVQGDEKAPARAAIYQLSAVATTSAGLPGSLAKGNETYLLLRCPPPGVLVLAPRRRGCVFLLWREPRDQGRKSAVSLT